MHAVVFLGIVPFPRSFICSSIIEGKIPEGSANEDPPTVYGGSTRPGRRVVEEEQETSGRLDSIYQIESLVLQGSWVEGHPLRGRPSLIS